MFGFRTFTVFIKKQAKVSIRKPDLSSIQTTKTSPVCGRSRFRTTSKIWIPKGLKSGLKSIFNGLKHSNWTIQVLEPLDFGKPLFLLFNYMYSERPKSERSAFGIFENSSVPKPSGYQTVSDNRTFLFGFGMFSPFTLQRSAFGI